VRGADGGLYLLTEEPFEISKLPQEKEKEVTKVLEKAQMNPVPLELPEHLVEEIQGIKTLGDQIAVSPETFVNDIPRNE
jgi:hypothetical protein